MLIQAQGGYILSVRVHSYDNPSNRCAGCGALQGCCDSFTRIDCGDEESSACDNEFFVCLKPLGSADQELRNLTLTAADRSLSISRRATALQCLGSVSAVVTTEVVGYPLQFQVNAGKWEVSCR